jgi:hypothetical protein
MLKIASKHFILGLLSVLFIYKAQGQKVLSIKEAEQLALANYGTIKPTSLMLLKLI